MTGNNHTTIDHRLKQLEEKIQEIEGLRVNTRQDESSYPTDSLAVKREKHCGLVPVEIQRLVKKREAEIIDVSSTQRTIWIIPHRGHGDYYTSLHEEDLPQEVYEIVHQSTETQEEAEQVIQRMMDCAEYVDRENEE